MRISDWSSDVCSSDLAIENGREELVKALRREGLPVQKLAAGNVLHEIAKELNYVDLDALHAAVGENHVSGKAIAARIARKVREVDPTSEDDEVLPTTVRQPRRPASRNRPLAGVHVEGLDDVMVRLSRCSTPVPGHEILGFVTRVRGVSVHRATCPHALPPTPGQPRHPPDDDSAHSHQATLHPTIH